MELTLGAGVEPGLVEAPETLLPLPPESRPAALLSLLSEAPLGPRTAVEGVAATHAETHQVLMCACQPRFLCRTGWVKV
jgi:hypothetical protein